MSSCTDISYIKKSTPQDTDVLSSTLEWPKQLKTKNITYACDKRITSQSAEHNILSNLDTFWE